MTRETSSLPENRSSCWPQSHVGFSRCDRKHTETPAYAEFSSNDATRLVWKEPEVTQPARSQLASRSWTCAWCFTPARPLVRCPTRRTTRDKLVSRREPIAQSY